MILQELRQLAERDAQPPAGCWALNRAADIYINDQGQVEDVVVYKGRGDSPPHREWFPFIDPEASGKPSIAYHKLEHLIGAKFKYVGKAEAWKIEEVKDKECTKKEKSLRLFAKSLVENTELRNNPSAKAWCEFIGMQDKEALLTKLEAQLASSKKKPSLVSGDYVAIFVNRKSWWQGPDVVKAWQEAGRTASDEGHLVGNTLTPVKGQCSVCGDSDVQLERLIQAFDGLTGSKEGLKPVSRTLSYVSFNRAAYRSRGLTKAYNASICTTCADRAVRGWNSLMSGEASREKLDDEVFGFWGEVRLKSFGTTTVDPKAWKDLLKSSRSGKPVVVAPQGVRVLGLGVHKATAYVTTWLKKDAEQASSALVRWWRWQDVSGEVQPEVFTLSDLVMALRPRSKWYVRIQTGETSTRFTSGERTRWRELLYVSLGESKVSLGTLAKLNARFAAEIESSTVEFKTPRKRRASGKGKETGVDCYPLDRLVLLNICLGSLNDMDTIDTNALTEKQRNAFNAGQMFRVICDAQRNAIGDAGQTILFTSAHLASTKPGLAMPRLVARFNRIYLRKLNRDNKGLAIYFDKHMKRLQQETVPQGNLSVEQTGWFWKGFYTDLPKQENK